MKPEDKIEALRLICVDARSDRKATETSARRLVRCGRKLALTDTEITRMMQMLDYADENGEPYRADIKRVWP